MKLTLWDTKHDTQWKYGRLTAITHTYTPIPHKNDTLWYNMTGWFNVHSKAARTQKHETTNTHTHTRLTALCPGLPGWGGTRNAKRIWSLLKQETVSCSGSAGLYASLHASTPTLCFLQTRCPSCSPTNSIKVLKAWNDKIDRKSKMVQTKNCYTPR